LDLNKAKKSVDIILGYELTVVDTPNVIYTQEGESKRMVEGLLRMITSKKNRYFYLITTPKMRKESCSFIEKLMKSKDNLVNFEYVFVEEDKDPDEELLKLAHTFSCPVISNDKFRQKKYDKYRGKKIEVWCYKSRKSDFCLKIFEKWYL